MPKVKTDYLEQKRNQILDAALAVAMRKPIHEVSMRDIISESGLSQGGIYRYFSNIDDVYITLINRENKFYDVKNRVDSLIESSIIPENAVSALFSLWEKVVLDNLVGVGKIYFELSTVYAADRNRLENFLSKVFIASEEAYLQEKFMMFVERKIDEGYFTPRAPQEDIFMFLMNSLSGIIRNLILSRCYHAGEIFSMAEQLDGSKAVRILCAAFILLLGGNERFISEEVNDENTDH